MGIDTDRWVCELNSSIIRLKGHWEVQGPLDTPGLFGSEVCAYFIFVTVIFDHRLSILGVCEGS